MAAPATLRVLVVEDELLIALAMEEALERLGCRVVGPFPQLQQGLDAIDREEIDAAVLDVNVRGEMIFPLASRLKAKGIPVVFCTGYAELSVIPDEFKAMPRLAKPCPEAALRNALVNAPRPAHDLESPDSVSKLAV